jgi:mannose-6-phosphate isomerase-like protein (cupin superfamily)
MERKIRRVVTGNDENGKSKVIFDGEPPVVIKPEARPGHTMIGIWETQSVPASNEGNEEAYNHEFRLLPPKNGVHCEIFVFPVEDPEVLSKVDRRAAFGAMQAAEMLVPDEDALHPYMHATPTLDFVCVLSGEIYLILETEEVHLKAGDVIVQRGTVHAWSNRGTKPATLFGILADASKD